MDAEIVTIKQIAEALGIKRQSADEKANKENWPYKAINKRGDRRFFINQLPEDVQIALALARASGPGTESHRPAFTKASTFTKVTADRSSFTKVMADRSAGRQELMPAIYNSMPVTRPSFVPGTSAGGPALVGSPELGERQNKQALAWSDLIRTYSNEKTRAKKKGESKVATAELFIKGYNTGMLLPNVFAVIGETSVKSVERNLKKFRDAGFDYTVLAPQWGKNKGRRKVNDDEFNTMLSFALHPNKLRIAEIVRLTQMSLKKRRIECISHEATLRRALEDWKNKNYDKWVFCREGEKALNDQCLPYLERDINFLEVGDVLVADGHVLNFNILHPFTGKPCRMTIVTWYDWASCMPVGREIMPTENIQCIAASLRRAILTLGKMPKVAYMDNGKAFKAKVFTDKNVDFDEAGFYGMFARLGIETMFAWTYNAQSKVVERFFGTSNELERLMPTYTGASIQDKPAHMIRNERLHKELHEKRYNGWMPTIEEANAIIAGWVTEYARRPHRGLKGLCPQDIFDSGRGPGVDEIPLRHLMMSMEIKRVHRNGVSFMGRNYYDDALYGCRDRVMIRYDFEDLGRVFVYDVNGSRLICEAPVIKKVHPMAAILGGKEDMEAVKEGIRRKRSLKKLTVKAMKEQIRQAPALIPIPERVDLGGQSFANQGGQPFTLTSNDALSMSTADPLRKGPTPKGNRKVVLLTQAEAEKIEAEAAKMECLEPKAPDEPDPIYMNDTDRYEYLMERECKGVELELDEMSFMRYFEKTRTYKLLKPRFDALWEDWMVPPEEEGVNQV